jgi:2-polyprenyl-6-methoxyphenol hydroxylase-like FAD-dependent oxidoreductase
VTLVGDAAHPMTPFLGQGACQALEDAVALGAALRGARDVPSALQSYEAARIPRANAFVSRSRMAGRIARLRNPLAVRIRNALVRRVSPAAQARQLARMIGPA